METTQVCKLKSVKKIESNSRRYDISVSKNHNFFANGILVHNCSGTFFTYWTKVWGMKTKKFSVASRNIWLKTESNNNYWKVAKSNDLKAKLSCHKALATVQGEICGPGVQSNKYKLDELDLYVFNILLKENGEMVQMPLEDMERLCDAYVLNMVPVIDELFVPSTHIASKEVKDVVQFMVKLSEGKSKLNPLQNREGIVVRLKSNPTISFKVINPLFLLEGNE